MNDIELYLKEETRMQSFRDVVGSQANSYVQSVIIAAQDPTLEGCEPESVFKAALRAASLKLSCDPIQKEAQLVPRFIKGKKVASFEPHYLGLYKMAMRTNKYRSINVVPVRKGQEVRMTVDGLHQVYENDKPVIFFPMFRGSPEEMQDVIGLLGHMSAFNGMVKTAYMTIEEIERHARKYSKAYQNDLEKGTKYSPWSNPETKPTMQMKTVLRDLLKWADLSQKERTMLGLHDEDVIEGEEVPEPPEEPDVQIPTAEDMDLGDIIDAEEGPEIDMTRVVFRNDAELIAYLVNKANVAQNEHEAKNIMEKCNWNKLPFQKFVTWASLYRGWRDAGEQPQQAAEKANKGEKPV